VDRFRNSSVRSFGMCIFMIALASLGVLTPRAALSDEKSSIKYIAGASFGLAPTFLPDGLATSTSIPNPGLAWGSAVQVHFPLGERFALGGLVMPTYFFRNNTNASLLGFAGLSLLYWLDSVAGSKKLSLEFSPGAGIFYSFPVSLATSGTLQETRFGFSTGVNYYSFALPLFTSVRLTEQVGNSGITHCLGLFFGLYISSLDS